MLSDGRRTKCANKKLQAEIAERINAHTNSESVNACQSMVYLEQVDVIREVVEERQCKGRLKDRRIKREGNGLCA